MKKGMTGTIIAEIGVCTAEEVVDGAIIKKSKPMTKQELYIPKRNVDAFMQDYGK